MNLTINKNYSALLCCLLLRVEYQKKLNHDTNAKSFRMLQSVDSAQMPCKSKYQIGVVNYERLAELLCTGRGCKISN